MALRNRYSSFLAKNQAVSYSIPSLKVINQMVAVVPDNIKSQFEKTILVGCQHNLETTVTIYKAMQQLGIRKIYSVGKCYSDSEIIKETMKKEGVCLMPSRKPPRMGGFQQICKEDIQGMWQKCLAELEEDIENIIVLDDGGRCLEGMPPYARLNYRVCGIEQTRGGLYSPVLNQLPFPVIEVASSALKREIEPIFIVKAIIKDLEKNMQAVSNAFNFNKKTTIGIIGNGAIGSAIAQYFSSEGYAVIVYDDNEETFETTSSKKKFYRMPTREAVIANAQCIFGCTGKDALQDISLLNTVDKDTVFISCTSEDREFLSTLHQLHKQKVIINQQSNHIICSSENGSKVVFFRGGYPFNFNGSPWNVPANEIEPTQGALLGAVIQAMVCAKKPINDGKTINKSQRLMLDPYVQQFVVHHWQSTPASQAHSPELLNSFNDINWIKRKSGGENIKNNSLEECFSINSSEKNSAFTFRARL